MLSTIQQLSPLVTEKINITNLTPPSFLCLFQARIWISNVLCRGLFCVCLASCFWWEVIVCFVDIGGIVYRHCLNFPSNKYIKYKVHVWQIKYIFLSECEERTVHLIYIYIVLIHVQQCYEMKRVDWTWEYLHLSDNNLARICLLSLLKKHLPQSGQTKNY